MPDKPGKVLIVDDDPDTLHLLALTLQRAGHEFIKAQTALEALHTLRATHPWPPPVIIFTAKAAMEDMIAGREAGAFRYLVKPSPREKILEAVRDALAEFRSRPPLKSGRI